MTTIIGNKVVLRFGFAYFMFGSNQKNEQTRIWSLTSVTELYVTSIVEITECFRRLIRMNDSYLRNVPYVSCDAPKVGGYEPVPR